MLCILWSRLYIFPYINTALAGTIKWQENGQRNMPCCRWGGKSLCIVSWHLKKIKEWCAASYLLPVWHCMNVWPLLICTLMQMICSETKSQDYYAWSLSHNSSYYYICRMTISKPVRIVSCSDLQLQWSFEPIFIIVCILELDMNSMSL